MNQAIITRTPMASMRMPMHVSEERIMEVPEPAAKFFSQGTTEPVHISTLLNPILEICQHPDRNRLMAEFFKDA